MTNEALLHIGLAEGKGLDAKEKGRLLAPLLRHKNKRAAKRSPVLRAEAKRATKSRRLIQ